MSSAQFILIFFLALPSGYFKPKPDVLPSMISVVERRNFSAPPHDQPYSIIQAQLSINTRVLPGTLPIGSLSPFVARSSAAQMVLGGNFFSSPIQCDSPLSSWVCDGWCEHPKAAVNRPNVVNLQTSEIVTFEIH